MPTMSSKNPLNKLVPTISDRPDWSLIAAFTKEDESNSDLANRVHNFWNEWADEVAMILSGMGAKLQDELCYPEADLEILARQITDTAGNPTEYENWKAGARPAPSPSQIFKTSLAPHLVDDRIRESSNNGEANETTPGVTSSPMKELPTTVFGYLLPVRVHIEWTLWAARIDRIYWILAEKTVLAEHGLKHVSPSQSKDLRDKILAKVAEKGLTKPIIPPKSPKRINLRTIISSFLGAEGSVPVRTPATMEEYNDKATTPSKPQDPMSEQEKELLEAQKNPPEEVDRYIWDDEEYGAAGDSADDYSSGGDDESDGGNQDGVMLQLDRGRLLVSGRDPADLFDL